MHTTTLAEPRSNRDILVASTSFAAENKLRSWWVLASTMLALLGLLALAAMLPWWPVALAASLCGSMVMVRTFIIFHDYKHGAMFRGNRLIGHLLDFYGMIFLCPPSHWNRTHNHHHSHVGELKHSSIGSFPIFDVETWKEANSLERMHYRVVRHPVTLIFAYITVFLVGFTLVPLIRYPRKNWMCGVSLLIHGSIVTAFWLLGGFWIALMCFWLPYAVASSWGAYLFYVQHNFRGVKILSPENWNPVDASILSTSFLKLNPILRWCTGGIGYHHIHHLNSAIPFYRLKEAHHSIPELQKATVTTLGLKDVFLGLSKHVWDPFTETMISYKEASCKELGPR
ncbi:fatty acid desaturase [Planctomycetota bacterium]|nr:fatty acid desaturase [Planctomycetota bacterium]